MVWLIETMEWGNIIAKEKVIFFKKKQNPIAEVFHCYVRWKLILQWCRSGSDGLHLISLPFPACPWGFFPLSCFTFIFSCCCIVTIRKTVFISGFLCPLCLFSEMPDYSSVIFQWWSSALPLCWITYCQKQHETFHRLSAIAEALGIYLLGNR